VTTRSIGRWAWLPIGFIGVLAASGASAAAPSTAVSCPEATLSQLRTAFIPNRGPTPAATATMLLPAGGSARLLFKQPVGADTDARSFRVFEVDSLSPNRMNGQEIPLISVDPAPGDANGRFRPTDSASLLVNIPPAWPPWLIRSFVILSCKGQQFSGWGSVTAPVSHPDVTLAICVVLGVLVYALAMAAVFAQRQKPHALEVKYPAVFGARPLKKLDFFNPIHLIGNAFNQGSVQKAQVILFSFLVGELVLALVLRTGTLVSLSSTVVALLGISGIGAATAQAAYQQKARLSFDNWAWLEKNQVLKRPSAQDSQGPMWRDLVLTNREFDVYKLQTIIFTIAVASALIVGGASNLSDFAVPASLLGILGLSQVVYVGGVLVKPPAVSNLDDAITRLRALGETVAAARIQKTDTDATGKLMASIPPDHPVASNARRQYDELADSVVSMIESTLEIEADRSKLELAA
jgi:hypothetical protein